MYDDSNSDSDGEDFEWVKDSEQYVNTDGFDIKVRANQRFKNYKNSFNNLIVSRNVSTTDPIMSATISFDSEVIITVNKSSEREYWCNMYSLKTYSQIFKEKYGGENQYIKMKEVA